LKTRAMVDPCCQIIKQFALSKKKTKWNITHINDFLIIIMVFTMSHAWQSFDASRAFVHLMCHERILITTRKMMSSP
jgi:hypothetical protein